MSDELQRFVEGFEQLSVQARIQCCELIFAEEPPMDEELKDAADFRSEEFPPEKQSLFDRLEKAIEECLLLSFPTA